MALLVGGEVEAAEAAYDWCVGTQRDDGSWPMKIVGGEVEDASGETNMSAYLAIGVWHHWLVRRDLGLRRAGCGRRTARPRLRRRHAAARGGIAWSQQGRRRRSTTTRCSPAARASTTRCAAASRSPTPLDDPQPDWELAGGRLAHALREHRDLFVDKADVLDGLVLPGPRRSASAAPGRATLLAAAGTTSSCQGSASAASTTNPWVTGAETCELVIALDALGDRERAWQLFADMQHLRHDDGLYWTGYVFRRATSSGRHEQTTYTSAAVILAADALSRHTPGSGHLPRRRAGAALRRDRAASAAATYADAVVRPLLTVTAQHAHRARTGRRSLEAVVERAQVDRRTAAGRRRPGRGTRRG